MARASADRNHARRSRKGPDRKAARIDSPRSAHVTHPPSNALAPGDSGASARRARPARVDAKMDRAAARPPPSGVVNPAATREGSETTDSARVRRSAAETVDILAFGRVNTKLAFAFAAAFMSAMFPR